MTAFWCRRLARKAASSRPLRKERASFAANSLSSRSAASRSGKSAIDYLGVSQDRLAADEISARLHRFALDEIDRAPEKLLQLILKFNQCAKIVADSRLECHEKVDIAAGWIEINAARSRTKNLQAG